MLHCLNLLFCQSFDPTLRKVTSALKHPIPLGCWSIVSSKSEPLTGASNNLRELDPNYILGEATSHLVFWPHIDNSSCSRQRTSSLKFPAPLGCWSITSTKSEPWIGTSNNPRELGPYWLWHQFNSLKFMEFILATGTYANIAKLLTHSCISI